MEDPTEGGRGKMLFTWSHKNAIQVQNLQKGRGGKFLKAKGTAGRERESACRRTQRRPTTRLMVRAQVQEAAEQGARVDAGWALVLLRGSVVYSGRGDAWTASSGKWVPVNWEL